NRRRHRTGSRGCAPGGPVAHFDHRSSLRAQSGLEPLSGSVAESSPADEGCGEVEESVVDVGTAFPSDGQATELVEQGEGLFDDPASRGDLVAGSSSWDVAGDATLPQFLVDAGVVVALVRDQGLDAVA